MKINKSYKFRLRPTCEQERQFNRCIGMTRKVWNESLERLIEAKDKGQYITPKYPPYNIIKELRDEFPYLQEASAQSLSYELEVLSMAFKMFFKGKLKHPNFRTYDHRESFSFRQNVRIDPESETIRLPKIGWVKLIQHRRIEGVYKRCTVSKSCGEWYVAITTEMEAPDVVHPSNKSVRIDGKMYEPLVYHNKYMASLEKIEKRKSRFQRALSRKKKAGLNYRKNQQKIGKLARKIARIRNDYLHNISAGITDEYAFITLEDLTGELRRQIEYKAAWKGGRCTS